MINPSLSSTQASSSAYVGSNAFKDPTLEDTLPETSTSGDRSIRSRGPRRPIGPPGIGLMANRSTDFSETRKFIEELVSNLKEETHLTQIQSFRSIISEIETPEKHPDLSSFGLEDRILSVLQTLSEQTLENLEKISPPSFPRIFKTAHFSHHIDEIANIQDESERSRILRDIARNLAEKGEFDRAIALANSIPDVYVKSFALGEISKRLVGKEEFDRAITIANSIPKDLERCSALRRISDYLAEKGELDQAIDLANTIPDEHVRSLALEDLSKCLAKRGEFDRAIFIAHSIPKVFERNFSLQMISHCLAATGEFDRAITLANSISDDAKSFALETISGCLVEKGKLDKATTIANSIPRALQRNFALQKIARAREASDSATIVADEFQQNLTLEDTDSSS